MDLQLKPEERLILFSADICPDDAGIARIEDCLRQVTDWEKACRLLIDRAAAPLFLKHMPRLSNASVIPESILYRLKQASMKMRARNMVLVAHFQQIAERLSSENIHVIVLKGALLSEWLYDDIGLRQFSDLDLLIPPNQCAKAIDTLRSMGYEQESFSLSPFVTEHSFPVHEPPMHKNGVSVEIHRSIHAANESYHINMDDMWKRAVPVILHGKEVLMLSPEDQLQHLCLHLDKHFRNGNFQFTCFYDLVNLINHKSRNINWKLFTEHCRQYGTEPNTFKYLSFISDYMRVCLPETLERPEGCDYTRKDLKKINNVLLGSVKMNYDGGLIRTLSTLNSNSDRWHYLFDLLFPPKDFMMKRYHLKRSSQLMWCYPYRFLVAFSRLGGMLIGAIRH